MSHVDFPYRIDARGGTARTDEDDYVRDLIEQLLFTAPGERVNLRNARFGDDSGPIDETCGCEACQHYSAGYLHHLVRVGELLGVMLVTLHNVFTMNRLMREVRAAIAARGSRRLPSSSAARRGEKAARMTS